MIRENLRNYEVSVWTLQDDFITVLRASKLEQKGQIEDPILTISDEGIESFGFSIPMYLFKNNTRYENPIWYTTRNGMIMQNLRKIKVIINKAEQYEKVYEFIINNVDETHSEKNVTCKVECDGLAFNELGKVGFKVSMSGDAFYDEDYDWFIKSKDSKGNLKVKNQPFANLQYWANKCLKMAPETDYEWTYNIISSSRLSGQWYYRIDMDYTAYSLATGDASRDRHKVYEDECITGWDAEGKVPTYNRCAEKERIVDIEESNLYNITQQIAEKFSVFCRYVYSYDDNYHIIGRTVVFYNSFIKESEGYLDLTYPYSTTNISRTIDSNDLTTKLIVRSVESDFGDSGLASITTVPANYSMEDYILNFEYLHDIKTISEEQYAAVTEFNQTMHNYNTKLISYEDQIITYENKLVDLKAKHQIAVKAQAKDQEEISNSKDLLNALTDNTGIIHITDTAPKSAVLLQGASVIINDTSVPTYYVKMPDDGVQYGTLHIYKKYTGTKTSGRLENEVTGTPVYDEYNGLTKVENIKTSFAATESKVVYLIYDYHPKLYYEAVQKKWEIRLGNDTAEMNRYQSEIDDINRKLDTTWLTSNDGGLRGLYTDLLKTKEEAVQEFQNLMGAALREGYWQPEEYSDYGEKECGSIQFTTSSTSQTTSTAPHASLIWDDELFADEQDISYKISITQSTAYYPCVKLNTAQLNVIKNHPDQVGIVFYPTLYSASLPDALKLPRCFVLGSQCEVRFVRQNNTVFPVLIVTGADDFTTDELTAMKQTGQLQAKIGYLTVEYKTGDTSLTLKVSDDAVTIASNQWLTLNSNYKCVYPRIKVSSLKMKNAVDQLGLQYSNFNPLTRSVLSDSDVQKVFEYAQDYYVLTRNNYYLLTPKSQEIIKLGFLNGYLSFYYALSTADEAIYIDAVQIAKENAEPKVSYSVDVGFVWPEILEQLHLSLNRLVHINDLDLKLNNVRGYISEIELHLDEIWNDTIIVQDYKDKFEDLFSSIVAQSAQMSKNAYANSLISQAFTANGALTDDTLSSSINLTMLIEEAYAASKFDTLEEVYQALEKIFNEAGTVLQDVNGSLSGAYKLTETGASILSRYASNVASALTPSCYVQSTKPTNWKPGDLWYNSSTGDRYMAMSYPTGTSSSGIDTPGWNQIYDGSLGSIKGAGLDVNAVTGMIDIYASSTLRARASSNMYLASDNIQITGNSKVNIGSSKWINIAASQGINILSSGTLTTGNNGAINNATYDSNGKITAISGTSATSAITLTPNGIDLAAAAQINIKSGKGIDIWSGSGTNDVSAIRVNPTEGIYLGSTQPIMLFSGNISGAGSTDAVMRKAAAVEISKDKILFGVANVQNNNTGAVFEATGSYIIVGVGNQITTLRSSAPTISNTVTGIKIVKDAISMAIGTGNSRTTLLMSQNDGITIATGTTANTANKTGSYVKITGSGIDVGSTANLYLNTANIQLQTGASSGTLFALGTLLTSPANTQGRKINLLLDKNGTFYVDGAIYARELYIGSTGASALNSDGKITSSTLDSTTQTNLSKASHLSVNSQGKIEASCFEADAQTNLTKAAKLTINSSGKIEASCFEESAQTNLTKASKLSINSSGKVQISCLESDAQTDLSKAAKFDMDSSGKLSLSASHFSSLGTSTEAGLYMTSTEIKLSTKSGSTVNNTVKIDNTGVYVYTGGKVDFSAADSISFKGSAISLSAISGLSDNYYGKISGVSINGEGVTITGEKFVRIKTSDSQYWSYNTSGCTYYDTTRPRTGNAFRLGSVSRPFATTFSGVFNLNMVDYYTVTEGETTVTKWYDVNSTFLWASAFPDTPGGSIIMHGAAWMMKYNTIGQNLQICFSPIVQITTNSSMDSAGQADLGFPTTNYWRNVYCLSIMYQSSQKSKHNITTLPSFSDAIDKLRPVSFVYNTDKQERIRYGLILEETAKVIPEICEFCEGGGTISYIDLIPILIKEVQSLRKRVADLESK